MKTKKLVAAIVETVAFDNQQVHLEGDDVHAVIELKNSKEHGSIKQGDVLTLSIGTAKETKAPAKKVAKKAAKK